MIETAVTTGCTLFISMILHNIAITPDDARRYEINRIVFHFNSVLSTTKDAGVVLIDRFTDGQIDAHLRDKFATGVRDLPYSPTKKLEQIIGYHYSAIGQSHFGSLTDIVLGSLRFAVNAHATQDDSRIGTASRLLQLLAPLFSVRDSSGKVKELSLFFSPKIIKTDEYREKYDSLKLFLAQNGIAAAQQISGDRTY